MRLGQTVLTADIIKQDYRDQGQGSVDQTTGNACAERACLIQALYLNRRKYQQERPDSGQHHRQPQGLNRQQEGIFYLLPDAFSDILQFSAGPPATDDQKQTDHPDNCLLME